jgi:glycosyltransferase involved in cell wall biosynthesis
VLAVPSLWNENAPLVVYAALAAKRPVVASDLPGLSETIQDCRNGLLFAPGRVAALAARLSRLIADRGLLNTLSRNCRTPKTMAAYVDALLGLYGRGPLQAAANRDNDGRVTGPHAAGL